MYDVPHLRFPEFSEEWEKCSIQDYGEVVTGNTPPTSHAEYYENGSYLWASPADLGINKNIIYTKNKLSLSGFKKTRNIPKGSVLVTCIGSTIGKMGMATETMSSNQQINSIVVNDKSNSDFVYYAICRAFPRYLSEVGVQAVPILSKSNFEKLPNYTTCRDEQDKIGYFLNLLDERIATQNKIIEDLKELKSAIIDYAFTNNKNVEREQILLSDISTKITRKNTDNRISNVLSNSANQGVVPQSGVFDREIANEENISNYIVISYNDFVYNPRKSAIAPYGPINKYNGELKGVISPLYLCFRTHDINAEYLAWYFKSRLWHEYIYKNGDAGVRHDRVSIKDDVFFSMPLNIHSKLEQGRIANKLNKIESFVMQEIQYLSLLQTQKNFLLQQMFI